jgi:hypothetical protein
MGTPRHPLRWLLWVSILGVVPRLAIADEPPSSQSAPVDLGPDEVALKNGGMLRGTVVGLEPGKQVVIALPGTNELRTIPWEEVAEVQRGKHARAATPAAPPTVASPPAVPAPMPGYPPVTTAAPVPGLVRVHINSDERVELREKIGESSGPVFLGSTSGQAFIGASHEIHYKVVCASPCDQVVDGRSARDFSIGADGVPPSDRFRLAGRTGDVTIDVDAGSVGRRIGGGLMIGFGILGPILGTVVVARAPEESNPAAVRAGGITAIAAGSALVIGGIVLVATSGTSIEIKPKASAATTRHTALVPRHVTDAL